MNRNCLKHRLLRDFAELSSWGDGWLGGIMFYDIDSPEGNRPGWGWLSHGGQQYIASGHVAVPYVHNTRAVLPQVYVL